MAQSGGVGRVEADSSVVVVVPVDIRCEHSRGMSVWAECSAMGGLREGCWGGQEYDLVCGHGPACITMHEHA